MRRLWPTSWAPLASVQQFCFKRTTSCNEQLAPNGLLCFFETLHTTTAGIIKGSSGASAQPNADGCTILASHCAVTQQYIPIIEKTDADPVNQSTVRRHHSLHVSFYSAQDGTAAQCQQQAQKQHTQYGSAVSCNFSQQAVQQPRLISQHIHRLQQQRHLSLFVSWSASSQASAYSCRGISGNRINREGKERPGAGKAKPLPEKKVEPRHNDQIRAPQLMVIFPDGSKQVLDNAAAKTAAASLGLDLVEVNAGSRPPVVRILDYGKYKHEQQKKADAAGKQQRLAKKMATPKEMQFSARIADHDLEVKLRKVLGFLEDGFRVQLTVKHGRDEEAAAAEALNYIAARIQAQFVVEVGSKQPQRRALAVLVKPVAQKP